MEQEEGKKEEAGEAEKDAAAAEEKPA